MKKIIGVIVLFCIFASCKTTKTNCDAYGNDKKTNKDRSYYPRHLESDSTYYTKK